MISPNEDVVPLSPDNAAVLFIDNQTSLMLGTQSIDTTLLCTNTEGLAKLAAIYDLPVLLTTTGGSPKGPASGLITPLWRHFNVSTQRRTSHDTNSTSRRRDRHARQSNRPPSSRHARHAGSLVAPRAQQSGKKKT